MAAKQTQLKKLPVESLVRGKFQPRRHFDEDELRELAESIKTTNGLLQPIVVREIADNTYEIIAGERRWRAAQLAEITEVDCLLGRYSDEQAMEAAIIENVNRSDLNPIEEANAYQRMINEFGYIHEEIAATVGKSRAKITNALRLLKLEERVQQLLINGDLAEGHGKILAGIDERQQFTLAQQCVAKTWSVRKLEQAIKKQTQVTHKVSAKDPNVKLLEKELSDHVGCPIKINYDEHGHGQLTVDFHNKDILDGLFDKLNFKLQE